MVDEKELADQFKYYARGKGWRVKPFDEEECAVVERGPEEIRLSWIGGKFNEGYYYISGGLVKKLRSAAQARQIVQEKPAKVAKGPATANG